ncbi:hypothetical protein [Cystobacter fuscus]|uniref:hypothetical protein n=1 Tax=Cystobacter fuscus TaxID=43 RepID=UPI002B322351|nr:hypothetical protein F0U63_12150 [Cystobacter fuscus]
MHLFNLFNLFNQHLERVLRANARLALAAGVALCLFAVPVWAGDASCIVGNWEGVIKEKDSTTGQQRLYPVFLDITSLEKDTDKARSGVIRFTPPRSCRLPLSYSGEDENRYYLTMTEPNGGLCVRLLNAQLVIDCVGPAELKARYEYPDATNAKKVEEFTLTRLKQAPAPKTKTP